MSDIFALAMGILFLAVWIGLIIYAEALRRAYIMGRTDFIEKRNRCIDYHGPALWLYRRGRWDQAVIKHGQLDYRHHS